MNSRDEHNLRRLYERTGRAAILKTARLVGRLDVAEEIVQATFLKLWEADLAFADDRVAYAWIYRTCHNAGIDHLRAHATRFEEGVEPRELQDHAGLDPGGEAFAERQWLAAWLSRLSDREAQVLAYRALDGMTQSEIAEVMGLSRKTIIRICQALEAKLAASREGDADLKEAKP